MYFMFEKVAHNILSSSRTLGLGPTLVDAISSEKQRSLCFEKKLSKDLLDI